ncbi:phage minor capsid protein [Streptomyces sp. NPDC016845]|uniref:phage minor capsid protein n=1 Tax=Streptomyces sp. NPDC016845 TaxID=3364972 RepID=UPI0037A9C627
MDDRLPNARAADRLAQEAVDVVTATHRGILRAVVDTFRALVARVAATPLLGTGSRRQTVQDTRRQFADAGIRAFVDKAGRRWSLPSYAEIAVRTATARAVTEAHMRMLAEYGVDLVIVPNAPRESPCAARGIAPRVDHRGPVRTADGRGRARRRGWLLPLRP